MFLDYITMGTRRYRSRSCSRRGRKGRGITARRSYRRRIRSSPCKGKSLAMCRASGRAMRSPGGTLHYGCKVARGSKRSYCRKKRNKSRSRR